LQLGPDFFIDADHSGRHRSEDRRPLAGAARWLLVLTTVSYNVTYLQIPQEKA
jgi:hypothetical protein